LLLCSNDYLGLAGDQRVVNAAAEAARHFGFGARAARKFMGDTTIHRELEAALAQLKGAEAALLFSSGFACNLGVISALVGPGDVICSDELNHASIVDGARLSRATIAINRHCDVSDLRVQLELKRPTDGRAMIATESVYSMDGDLTPLTAILDVAREFDAIVLLDEAHATGVLGSAGEGLLGALGLHGTVDIVTGTLGKALGSVGGFVTGTRELIDFLSQRARTFLFDTALPTPAAAAALEAMRIMAAEPQRVNALRHDAEILQAGLRESGYTVVRTESAILPVEFDHPSEARRVSDKLLSLGIITVPVGPPLVPAGTSRIRVQACAAHTQSDIDRIVAAFSAAARPG
jgi:8-amino-7-oxononanoate synthase